MKTSLKKQWEDVCNEYARIFCTKHSYRFDPDMWVANDPGSIIEVCDMFVGIDEIRYDVDNNIPEEYFAEWYWKGLEVYELTGKKYMNYPSFCKGAPDEWTQERLEKIREAHKRIEEKEKELKQLIEEYEQPVGGIKVAHV